MGESTKNDWWKRAVFYEIYVRSFKDSNRDGVGDLPGIIEKLEYLHSLGVDALWLTPINPSTDYDFGYDVTDYTGVNPLFGNISDFQLLLKEAHALNIKLILDFVLNHTSVEHPWFLESRSSRTNPKRDWYIWRDGRSPGKPPNRWMSRVIGKAWEFDQNTGQYYYHAFFKQQPDLNWRNPEVKKAMFEAAKYWLDLGVDGFRLDLVNHLVEDELLRENPFNNPLNSSRSIQEMLPYEWQKHLYDRDLPETHEILKELRSLTDSFSSRVLVGEAATFDTSAAASYYGSGDDELHLVFNFNFFTCPFQPRSFLHTALEWHDALPSGAWPCLALSNHDQPRHIGRFAGSFLVYGESQDAVPKGKIAASFLLTLRGSPFLYYGEEIGMRNSFLWPWEVKDPAGKIFWPAFQGRDMSRTPMQWSPSSNAGFSTAKPWLRPDPSYSECNVLYQEQDPYSLLSFYRKLIRLRKEREALALGALEFIPVTSSDYLAYMRKFNNESILIVLNFRNTMVSLSSLGEAHQLRPPWPWKVLLGTSRKAGETLDLRSAWMRPYEVLIAEPVSKGEVE